MCRWTLLLLMIVATTGCSTANQDSPLYLVDQNGNHPAGWVEIHGSYAIPDAVMCMPCHGEDLDGGISRVSCSSSSYKGQSCHAAGQDFHNENWVNKTYIGTNTFHATAYSDDDAGCIFCHTPPPLDEPYEGYCWICHFGVTGARSPGGWVHDLLWHERFIDTIYEPICLNCHDTNNSFGLEPFCHNCH